MELMIKGKAGLKHISPKSMIDALHPPIEVLDTLARLKASCVVRHINKVNFQSETSNVLWSREEERAWKDKYKLRKRCKTHAQTL
jgi:hypothetical protein